MTVDTVRSRIRELIGPGCSTNQSPQVSVKARSVEQDHVRTLVEYDDLEGGQIPAYLLEPLEKINGRHPAVLIHHQHNGEWHLGKSEVCGLAGNSLQAFGPALAALGFVVLIPDSICFEDRRYKRRGLEPDKENDRFQHFLEMEYRLVDGDNLMRKVLHDAEISVKVLRSHSSVDPERIGVLGHSYGGNTVLFQMALDESISYGCASGAACSYENKKLHRVGLEMALVIPGFCKEFDMHDVVSLVAARKLLMIGGRDDDYARDEDTIFERCKGLFVDGSGTCNLHLKHCSGAHDMTRERFQHIVNWFRTIAVISK